MSVPSKPLGAFVPWRELWGYFRRHYDYEYVLHGDRVPVTRVFAATEWCTEQWGPPSSCVQVSLGFFCTHDSRWVCVGNTFFFKDADSCVLFQLRWR